MCRSTTPARCSERRQLVATASTSRRCARSRRRSGRRRTTSARTARGSRRRTTSGGPSGGRTSTRCAGVADGNALTDLRGKVGVVTGGAAGVGRGLVEALLDEGARVVIADIEEPVLNATVADLAGRGEVSGVRTDVSDFDSVEALAKTVFDRYGACHLLFNNAGVGTGGGGYPWEHEPNDWKWCFGVNVFGM